MEAGSRVLLPCSQVGDHEESMIVLREGIDLAINFSRAIQFYVMFGYFGTQPALRIRNLCDNLFSCFIQSKLPPTKIVLKNQLTSYLDLPDSLHDSLDEVSDQLLSMHQECLRRDFSSIQILREAIARRLMWKHANKFEMESDPFRCKIKKSNLAQSDRMWKIQDYHARKAAAFKNGNPRQGYLMALKSNSSEMDGSTTLQGDLMNLLKANSSEMDGSRTLQGKLMNLKVNSSEMDGSRTLQGDSMIVFQEGVSLFMHNLWAQHVFVEKKCGSNPSLMLQYLADVILFWFTQTIKPLSHDYIERILKNEMYSFPVINYDINKEVAKKLMVMYEECLQDNFSSVEKLKREVNLERAHRNKKEQALKDAQYFSVKKQKKA